MNDDKFDLLNGAKLIKSFLFFIMQERFKGERNYCFTDDVREPKPERLQKNSLIYN